MRLSVAKVTDDVKVTTQGGRQLFGLPDGAELLEDGFAACATLVPRQTAGELNGIGDITELVKETALGGGVEMDGLERPTQSCPAVMDDELQLATYHFGR